MEGFVEGLEKDLIGDEKREKGEGMGGYMKNELGFVGIETGERREVLGEVIEVDKVGEKEEFEIVIGEVWCLGEGEFEAGGVDLLEK
ncbi:DNA alkylation repair protein [Bacillus mycoides]|uniref:DNA alkylation repair protein n=1 Tax=Bacillus mycoides TaxID=1405 RepID=UPI0011A28538|nr:DNA alkylation repair protein [Bacillus mycoides]